MARIGIRHPIGSATTGGGSGYVSSILGEYKIDANTYVPPPSSGYIQYDNATQISATNIYINDISTTGVDSSLFFELLLVGARFVVQDKDDHANIQIFEISSAPVDNTTYWTIPVTLLSSSGTGTTGFANNHNVFAAAFNPEVDEKVKYNASDASAGYLADKTVSGSGITLSEGTGGDADKLKIEANYTDLNTVYARLDATNQPFTGQIVGIAGSVSAPSYAFTGALNTGIFSPTSTSVAIALGGVQELTLTTTLLTSNTALTISGAFQGATSMTFSSGSYGNAGLAGTPTYSFSSDTDTGIYQNGANILGFSTGGTLRMQIGSTGLTRIASLTADRLLYSDTNKDLQSVTLGTGLSLSSGTLTNTAPDQTVSIAGDTNISVGGTYPNFTLSFINGSGYLTSESDPVFSAWLATPPNISTFTNDSGYLTSFTETDPVFTASDAFAITSTDISNWNTAYGWGDHGAAGYAKLDSSNQPFTSGGFDSLNTSLRYLYDTAGVGSIAWDNRRLFDESANPIMDWNSGQAWISDSTGAVSIYYVSRQLIDSSTKTTIDWENNLLKASDLLNTTSVDWFNRTLNDSNGMRLDWAQYSIYDNYGNLSIDWDDRLLKTSLGFSTFDWENLKFPTLPTDGILRTTGGDGTITVDTGVYALLDGTNQPFTGNLEVSKSNPKITLTDSATDTPEVWLEKLTTLDGSQLVSQNRRYQPANAISISGTSGTMSSPPSLTNFSYSFWIWSDGVSFQSVGSNGTNIINIRGPSAYPPYFRIQGFGGSTVDFFGPSGQPAMTGRWTHIVIIRNASTGAWSVYYDGVASPQNGSICGTTTLSSFTVPTTTNGDLDEFICYDKVLSVGEIAALYNGGAPTRITDYTNVVWHWSADQSSGTTLTDNSGNGRNVTGITGSSWITGKVATSTPEPLTDVPLVKITNNGTANSYGNLVFGYYTGSYGTDNYYDGLNHYHRVLGTTRLQVTSSGITVTGAATISSITASTLTISGALTMSGAISGATSITFTNGAYGNAGLVGTPTYSASSDTNTGMYFPAADTLGWSTGGVERMRITSSGLVGLATSTPSASARLDIADGGMSLVLGANSSSTTRTNVTDKISRVGGYHYTNAEEPVGIFIHSSTTSASTLSIGGGSILMNAATAVNIYTAATTTTTTGSIALQVNSSQNVGIGVTGTDIAARLHSLSTTEQLRLGYDLSNYFSATVSSAGAVTFNAVGASAGFTFSDSITMADAKDISFNSTTGTKLGTSTSDKLSLWNATPDVQPTTAITAATFTANTSGIVDDTATFDGYTIGQIVAALRRIGALA